MGNERRAVHPDPGLASHSLRPAHEPPWGNITGVTVFQQKTVTNYSVRGIHIVRVCRRMTEGVSDVWGSSLIGRRIRYCLKS